MNGIITEVVQFFWNLTKRQRLIERLLEKNAHEAMKTHLKVLHRTRWVECHQAYGTFCGNLYTYVFKGLEAIFSGQLFRAEPGDWNWDLETRTLANSLSHRFFDIIGVFLTTMKILAFVNPTRNKLQKQTNDVI